MSGSLLDTSVLIADESAAAELPPTAAISVITVGELNAGVHMARTESVRDARSRRLEAVRRAFAPLPIDEPVAERYGELLAFARSRRRSEKASDLLILATAAAGGRTLHTLDRRQAELARAAGIEVVAV